MSLLSGFNVSFGETSLLGQAALAAFVGGTIPSGWTVVPPSQLALPPQHQDGNYFTNNGASAIVLKQGSTWIIAFRGTDGLDDVAQYSQLIFGTYINNFQPLLSAVASQAPIGTNFYFTGASLGGGATNLAAVAEHEREMISKRTAAALAAAKARGTALGNRTNMAAARSSSHRHNRHFPTTPVLSARSQAGRPFWAARRAAEP